MTNSELNAVYDRLHNSGYLWCPKWVFLLLFSDPNEEALFYRNIETLLNRYRLPNRNNMPKIL